ncbi:Hypothetical Protein BW244_0012 [Candidatus Carsonella ruddii]|uniref:Uncharacterized protein n=1 Tax=Carsonella ruddii TaxID=114186 RepID=A0A1U9RRA4_CARRU|nr:Hypothetical Protein BW244_0012 [Candidatus Carsonella ruddii]
MLLKYLFIKTKNIFDFINQISKNKIYKNIN